MSDSGLVALDAAARRRALDVEGSFIVRAPAGSGKTELLIQRVLALLATVDAPEEVVAITFTRKAAAEMRQRVLDALIDAGESSSLETSHKELTRALAREVMQRDAERRWELLANPSRLRVQTIDALAQGLARQLPLALGLGTPPDVTELADTMYMEAARATLRLLESDEPLAADIARLLEHLDNDVERAVRLLALMLQRRDQWLRHLGNRERAELEAALQRASAQHMRALCELIPAEIIGELIALARYAGANAGGALAPCVDLTRLPEAAADRLDAWRGLAALLLTEKGGWRAKFDKRTGFPSGNDLPDGERTRARAWQERIRALVATLGDSDHLRAALHALRQLPPPRYSDAQWEVVQSIIAVLPRAAAELTVVFAQAGVMDFTEVTQRAVRALGDGHDLAAAVDARIRHLLIDEFQDTSITQYDLIERLVADWTLGDGRTLFIVGDPMQSIYRFREAEVGLFLNAWRRGVGPLALEPLTLSRNFRSQQGIVEWVNRAFARVLPPASDIATGAVSFEAAAAVDPPADDPPVTVHALIDADARHEAQRVVDIVSGIRTRSRDATIGLLVRQRSHLTAIGPALRAAGLLATAVELDPLATRPLVGDLIALTRALVHAGDRIAWLAVLRAPWCGLTLADLAALAEGESTRAVPELLDDPVCRARLSADGQLRIERVAAVLQHAASLRDRLLIVERVVQTWLALGGPACIDVADRADAERYFEHLSAHVDEQRGVVDVVVLEASLQTLFASPDPEADPAFQVMTIHKAKGLEFDYVIVPGLAGIPRSDDPALLVWFERASDEGAELLLAPIPAGGSDKDLLVRWVEAQAAQRQRHEDERLTYVAATRARRALHWIGSVRRDESGSLAVPESSLAARLWPALADTFEQAAQAAPAPAQARSMVVVAPVDQSLRRLPAGWKSPPLPATIQWFAGDALQTPTAAIEFSWAGETARRVGTIVHRWLQRIAEDRLAGWDAARIQTIAPQIERALAAGGLSGGELVAARARVADALNQVLQDDRGRWILGPHPEHRAELRLTVAGDRGVRRLVLDRMFVASDGTRWIVDYKVGAHEGADVERFLDEEQQRYRLQLETYGAAFRGSAMLGLYFPLMPGWRAWQQTAVAEDLRSADIIRDGGPPRTEVP